MRVRPPPAARSLEPNLTGLINIIFLILIFFIVAGTLRPFSAADIELAKTDPETSGVSVPVQLIAHRDGSLTYEGTTISEGALADALAGADAAIKSEPAIIVADGSLEARRLMAVARIVRAAGFTRISVLTEKRTPR